MTDTGTASGHKLLGLLEALGAVERPQRLGELAERTGLTKPTVHRLLGVLADSGWAVQRDGGFYELGPRARALGHADAEWGDGVESAIHQLATATNQTVHVAVLADGEVLYTHKATAPQAFIMRSRVGSRMPAHSTAVGKAMLATLPEPRLVALLTARGLPARTPATHTDVDELLAELATVRECGYALDREENEVNVRCMAVPIRLGDNGIAGVSISTITFLTPEAELLGLLPSLRDTAARVVAALS
ncbi:IclR family transcriptional regulator [Lapillicoccus jejuensis]|uniref:IclR family transcriptional regulator n=1 Tax=Lapillicoccus jejuensis TaxID=402171 RepID=A0A542E1L3_9MICO|nr:IclR family transcriptional regulator [Lapillicoccus jejuensis]TQJ09223.1 IclR family transcriptional regulator [Lapillicoccus jejuensis]